MAKDVRRFGAKGPAMGMLRLARDAGLYRGSMTTLCAAGKVIEKFAPMCAAKMLGKYLVYPAVIRKVRRIKIFPARASGLDTAH